MKLNWAERYLVNNPIRLFVQGQVIRWMKRKRPVPPGSMVLEVGCGRGAGAGLLLKEFQPGTLHALDLDLEMILQAQNYLTSQQKPRVFLYLGDVTHLPYQDGALDAVFGFGVLHHVLDWRGALAEIARVLKTGGVYCLEEFYPPLYQNFLTKRLFLHPEQDRFFSHDFKEALKDMGLPLSATLEIKKLGILGVAIKTG